MAIQLPPSPFLENPDFGVDRSIPAFSGSPLSSQNATINSNLGQRQTVSSGGSTPPPKKVSVASLKARILQPSLTSHFECYFAPPPEKCKNFIKQGVPDVDVEGLLMLSCSEASLPGSSLTTHELNNDITGVTQRHAYRRLYDDRADFTFYVNNSYTQIRYFESWIRFIAGEQAAKEVSSDLYKPYRVQYPNDYKTSVYITKFERDTEAVGARNPQKIVYTFHNAFPLQVQSMPVSYESSQLLKCTVSFSYDRYTASNVAASSTYTKVEERGQPPVSGISDIFTNPQFGTSAVPELPGLNGLGALR
jgi:hypothetical protein